LLSLPVPQWARRAWVFSVAVVATFVLVMVAPMSTFAQERDLLVEEDSERRRSRWTLQSAFARARSASPRVRVARARIDAAQAHRAYESVPVVGNPFVSLRALFGIPDQSAATYGVVIGLPFDLSGRQGAWSAEVDQVIAEAEEAADAAVNETNAEVASAYIELAMLREALSVALDRLRIAEDLHRSVRASADVHEATALDMSLAASELGIARSEVAERRLALLAAEAAFRAALDLDPHVNPEVEPLSGPDPPDGMSLSDAIALASERRAEPRAHQAAARRYRLSEDRLFAESVDLLLVGLEWESQGNQRTAHSFGVSAGTSLPFVRTAQGDRAVARGLSMLELELGRLVERNVEREAAAAWHAFQASIERLHVIESAQEASERALVMSEELLMSGAADLFRVLAIRRDAFALRARRIEARRDAWNARIALERAIGGAIE
jgi:outer membrane protein TolC